mmetsp:Transcript_13127/g.17285  ORF Transcript_13127/g.17285 Transcript_13127/m.17285 type:complete len:447 (-) Transcript_13127:98-1438(-)|eukprot:CAMPEP_0185751702 /NCGR_PEP_ID=MMETSP1174-20130828/10474_1 /TAXON_ID=35687 /ORGANISM="Dictyocha speculum, Strain CCMP1381" /LENGTH=446 /DNA_ID=CAMNT_0028428795 /DNA_START=41 /DNA_END=1381 /DNA_ORIENTATION=+
MNDTTANTFTNRQIICTLLRTLSSMLLIPITPALLRECAKESDYWDYTSYASTLQFAGAAVQLTLLPYAGALSDRLLGRKLPLLGCGVVQLLYLTTLLLVDQGRIGMSLLLAVAIFNQVSSYVAMAITSAALGDAWQHNPGKLAGASGKLGGIAFGIGMLVGPALGSIIAAKAGGSSAAILVALALSSGAIFAQSLLMEETAPMLLQAKDGERNVKRAATSSKLDAALAGVSPLAGLNLIFKNGGPQLRAVGMVALISGLTKGEQAIYMPFMVDVWKVDSSGIAVAMTVVGLVVALSQALLAKPLVAKLGARGALSVGLCSATFQRLGWACFTQPVAMGASFIVGAPGLTSDAFIKQLTVESWEAGGDGAPPPQGEISAALTAVGTLSVLLSSLIIGRLYSIGKERNMPGLPFAFGAMCSIVALLVLVRVVPPKDEKKQAEKKKHK